MPIKFDEKISSEIANKKTLYIITANEVEEAIFLSCLYDFYGNTLPSYIANDNVYQIIIWEEYAIVHNHTIRTGEEYTRRSINSVTKILSPDYIILLGICYGININHGLGTVIISNNIEGFRINFRDGEGDGDILFEAETEFDESPSGNLTNLILNFFNYPEFPTIF